MKNAENLWARKGSVVYFYKTGSKKEADIPVFSKKRGKSSVCLPDVSKYAQQRNKILLAKGVADVV